MYFLKFCRSFIIIIVLHNIINASGFKNTLWLGWDKDLDWWQSMTLYQIYPRSFQDSDGDGVGDIKGIESRLDYFKETGITGIWLSPIFKSPMADLGYDISNFTAIDPIFGTIDDFISLVKGCKQRGIYLLLDLVPNHTSDEHDWFIKSKQGIERYKNYYVWKDPKILENGTSVEPNNWLSLFGGPGWTWDENRKQYYYHQFNAKQPDLNLTNPDVLQELNNVIKFWLDLGVNGFRVDAVKHFYEDPEFRDEVCIVPTNSTDCRSYDNMVHNYTTDWPTTYDLMVDWRKYLDEYKKNSSDKITRVMLTEAYSTMKYTMAYYGNTTHPGAHAPFNFFLVWWPKFKSDAMDYCIMIAYYYLNLPNGCWGNWVAGNHDNHRIATRVGNEMVDAFFILGLLMPGTAVTYQGDELGQPDTMIRPDQIRDPNNNGGGNRDVRDPERGPFLWDDSPNAGFTTAKIPWEPIHPSYWELNLQTQKKTNRSNYNVYKQILSLRNTKTIQKGSFEVYNVSKWVLAFTRRLPGYETYVAVINVGTEVETVTLSETIPLLPFNLTVVVSSANGDYENGEIINSNIMIHESSKLLVLRPKASVVLKTARTSDPTLTTTTISPPSSSSPLTPTFDTTTKSSNETSSSYASVTKYNFRILFISQLLNGLSYIFRIKFI